MLTQAELFAGIRGFGVAGERAGVKTFWVAEIDKNANIVGQRHFPEVPNYGDVTTIRGDTVKPVDIVTFGSPCQDLSVAGKRAGLDGSRSSLFHEAVRIIEEMRGATNDRYPRIAVWENVPGALSSNKGEDFRVVLESLVQIALPEASIPRPRSKRWANAGMVRGNGWSLAWRILDAQHFGVPQRRRRIVVVVDLAGERAGEILLEREGVRGHSASGEETRADAAEGATGSVGGDGFPTVTGTLLASGAGLNRPAGCASEVDLIVPVAIDLAQVTSPTNGSVPREVAPTLNQTAQASVIVPVAVDVRNLRETAECGTLQAKSNGGYSLNYVNPNRVHVESRKCVVNALTTGFGRGGADDNSAQAGHLVPIYDRVRRLTPVECERLQGFVDDWTEGISDSARYKALGNSIAVPVFTWLFERIVSTIST